MRYLIILAAVLCMAACEKMDLSVDQSTDRDNGKRDVQFVMKGLSVDYGTRATVSSEGMTDLYVWEGTTILAHQTAADADFGAPTVSLSIGAHDLTFVASKADGQSWSSGVWSCSKVRDTYGCVLSYTVSSSSSSKQVQLTRCNGKLAWTIEDAIPAAATTLSMSVPTCYGLNGDLNGVTAGIYNVSASIASHQGETGYMPTTMVLPSSHADGQTISPTITITDGTNTICSYTTECSIYANQVTNIHGNFFNSGDALTMVLSNEWGGTNDFNVR